MGSVGKGSWRGVARAGFVTMMVLAPMAVAAPARAAVPPRYVITDLGALGVAETSVAKAISNAGVVVGSSTLAGVSRAVRWSGGSIVNLGTLPGGGGSTANAVNDAGQIAGTADRLTTRYGSPVRWNAAGVIQDLGGPADDRLGAGNGIDPAGRVAGGQRPAGSEGGPLAILYDQAGAPAELGDPPDSLGAANAVNAAGQVVGDPAFVWRGGHLTKLPGLPGGSAEWYQPTATAINISGQIAGSASASSSIDHRAVIWRGGAVADVGTIDGIAFSEATGINAAGQVVGTADPKCRPCPAPRAWFWQPGGVITALDTLIPAGSGWTLREANGINDRGQIVGSGLHGGALHAFLLTPVFSATVNFQPASSVVPAGYTADTGAVYGPRAGGLTYGWNVDNSANGREREAANAPDQRYDTFNHLQGPGGATSWELAVPNGAYLVHLVAGDPGSGDGVYKIDVEGAQVVSGTPSAAARFVEGVARVLVSDGRLTITNAAGAVDNKIAYLDVLSSL